MRHALSLAALVALLANQLAAQQQTDAPQNQTNRNQAAQSSANQGADAVHRNQGARTQSSATTTDAASTHREGTFRSTTANTQNTQRGGHRIVRASKIIGTNVKNHANEDLGSINDLAIDPLDGRVAYAAVSMGGFLGVGDKLFAVPWDAIECREENGSFVAYLDIDRQRMENAQGFDQNHWPDMANEQWRTENDRRYSRRMQRHEVLKPTDHGAAPPAGSQNPTSQRSGAIPQGGTQSGTQPRNEHPQPGSAPRQ